MGGALNQVAQSVCDAVEVDHGVQTLAAAKAHFEGWNPIGRWSVSEDEVADGAEPVDVEGNSVGVVGHVNLRGEVDPGRGVHVLSDMARALQVRRCGRCRTAIDTWLLASALPITHTHAD